MNDISFSSSLHNLLKHSGYEVETGAGDEDGHSHKITFKAPYNEGAIFTYRGKIAFINVEQL